MIYPLNLSKTLQMALFALALIATAPIAAAAQTPESGPSPASRKTLALIHDLDLLPSLAPLRLTQVQMDALRKALVEVKDASDARYKKEDAELAGVADEVGKAHAAMLAGEPLPEELRVKLAALDKEFAAGIAGAKKKAIADVLVVVKERLTAEQKTNIEAQIEKFLGGKRVPKEFAKNPSKAPADVVQDLALSAYVDRVLLDARTPDLLAKMKPAAPAAPADAPAAATPATDAKKDE